MASTLKAKLIEQYEREKARLSVKRDALTREIDREIEFVSRMLAAARKRGGAVKDAPEKSARVPRRRLRTNSQSITATKSPLALFLYDLLGKNGMMDVKAINAAVDAAYSTGKLDRKYANGSIAYTLTAFSCFVQQGLGTWVLGRAK